ncbi:MAG: hypothetical protein HPY55_05980 [Firmicutes bacterium]|nr:hypothetical protein [Bacillota bacterium]
MSSAQRLSLYGVFTALITLATTFLKVPGPTGFYHLGDVFIYTAAAVMGGPFAAATASVGSALADVWAGYATFAPWTLVIKGVAGYVAGAVPTRYGRRYRVPSMIAGALIITAGYAVATAVMFDPAAAVAETAGNLLQSGVGVLGAIALVSAVERAFHRGSGS